MNILIVEDEKALAHALELKLTHEGFNVTLAANGQECVDVATTHSFDVILLDLIMPVLDGFQVLEQLGKLPVMPAVFVLSNLSQHEDETRVMALGAHKFFIKSNTPLSLIVEEIKKMQSETKRKSAK